MPATQYIIHPPFCCIDPLEKMCSSSGLIKGGIWRNCIRMLDFEAEPVNHPRVRVDDIGREGASQGHYG